MAAEELDVPLDALVRGLTARGARLGRDAVAHVARALAVALAEAHAATDDEGLPAPRLHLALGPAAVRVGAGGEVVLLGLAPGGGAPAPGEAAFAAPEQASGGRPTARTDVYRLALLVSWLLGGDAPPAEGVARPVAALDRAVPPEVAAALERALEPSPGRRRITAEELQLWLAQLGDPAAGREELRAALTALRAPLPAAERSRPLSTAQAVLVALLTAAVVVALGVYFAEVR